MERASFVVCASQSAFAVVLLLLSQIKAQQQFAWWRHSTSLSVRSLPVLLMKLRVSVSPKVTLSTYLATPLTLVGLIGLSECLAVRMHAKIPVA
jgi:hypothetical protein